MLVPEAAACSKVVYEALQYIALPKLSALPYLVENNQITAVK